MASAISAAWKVLWFVVRSWFLVLLKWGFGVELELLGGKFAR